MCARVCAHALMHSVVFYIVKSMQELLLKLNCLLCIDEKAERDFKVLKYGICMFLSSSYRCLFSVWYLTFNKASAFANRRISECVCVSIRGKSRTVNNLSYSPICWRGHCSRRS